MQSKYFAYAGSYFDIEWYCSSSGKLPALEYYKTLDHNHKKKFWFLIETLGNVGKIHNKEKFRHEGDYIFALKPGSDRFLCFFAQESKIIITNAFAKKTDKLPVKEKQQALARRKDYLFRTTKGTYYEQET